MNKKIVITCYLALCLLGWSIAFAPAGTAKVGSDKKTWDTVAQKAAI